MPDTAPDSTVLAVLDGLTALRMLQHTTHPDALAQAHETASDLADTVAESGDRITAPGNFRRAADHTARANALNAASVALALGARQEDGITWAGRHWCTAPHPGCPYGSRPARQDGTTP